MVMGYSFRMGDMGEAECVKCGSKFFHVYGRSSHRCGNTLCDGPLRCGMPECEAKDGWMDKDGKGVSK